MNALLLYSNEIDDFIENYSFFEKFNLDEVFYMVKDYSGINYYDNEGVNKLYHFCLNYNIKLSAWVVVQSIRYIGYYQNKLSFDKHNFKSMVSINGRSTFDFPIKGDGGFEDYLCPSSKVNMRYINRELLKIQETGYFSKICLDLIRFPIKEWKDYCYCDNCNELAKKTYGDQHLLSEDAKKKFNQFLINNFFQEVMRGINLPLGALIWCNYIGENVGHSKLSESLDFRIILPYDGINNFKEGLNSNDYNSCNIDECIIHNIGYLLKFTSTKENNIFLSHHFKLSKIILLMKYQKFNFLLLYFFKIEKIINKWVQKILLDLIKILK